MSCFEGVLVDASKVFYCEFYMQSLQMPFGFPVNS